MGFLNELKKLFFGASSVAKSASEKTGNYIKDEAEDLYDDAIEGADKLGEKLRQSTDGLRQSINRNSSELKEKAREKMNEIGDSPIVKKAAETSEKIGDRILDEGEKIVEKGKNLSEDVGSRVLEAKDDLVDKARDVANKAGKKLSETMDKAEKWAEAEKQKPKKEFADDDLDISKSLLDDTDDFFSKASKYADGEYDAFSEGKITIGNAPDSVRKKDPSKSDRATGFEDLDGDGNEIIDDAILEDEGKSSKSPESEEE